MKNYYEILEVSKTSTQDEIKKSYKNLMRKYHPDLNKGNDKKFLTDMSAKINDAYDILGNVEKRKEYDEEVFGSNIDIHIHGGKEEYSRVLEGIYFTHKDVIGELNIPLNLKEGKNKIKFKGRGKIGLDGQKGNVFVHLIILNYSHEDFLLKEEEYRY